MDTHPLNAENREKLNIGIYSFIAIFGIFMGIFIPYFYIINFNLFYLLLILFYFLVGLFSFFYLERLIKN